MAHRKNVSKGKGRSASRDALHHTLRLSALAGALGAGLGVDVPTAVAADPTVKPGAKIGRPAVPTPGQSQQYKIVPKPGQSPQMKTMPKLGTMQQKVSPSPGLSPQIKLERRAPGGSVQGKEVLGPGGSSQIKIDWTDGPVQGKKTGDAMQQKVAPAAQMRKGPAGALQRKVDEAMGVVPSPSPGASKAVEAQPFKRGLLNNSLSLYSRKGQRLEARFTNKTYALYDLSRGKNARAADGTYRLQGGGRIKVEKGVITWADDLAIQRSAMAGVLMTVP